MVCLSVILLHYRLHSYAFVIKDFVTKKGLLFVLDPVCVSEKSLLMQFSLLYQSCISISMKFMLHIYHIKYDCFKGLKNKGH